LVRTFAGVSIGIIAISFASIFIKFCDDVPSIMIATYRLTLSSIILLIIAKSKGIRLSSFNKKHLLLGMLGGLFLSLHFSFWISSLKFRNYKIFSAYRDYLYLPGHYHRLDKREEGPVTNSHGVNGKIL